MSRRTERLNSLMRELIGEAVLSKLSDPRINPARTAITRVEVPEDLLTARVYVSVMDTEARQQATVRALRHAAGHIQELISDHLRLRHTPVLSFERDTQYKKTLETLTQIDKAMEEIRRKDAQRRAQQTGRRNDDRGGD
ncbi:MAG: 30S ribosome-binding factor RbfA [Planctomycetota bacterium]